MDGKIEVIRLQVLPEQFSNCSIQLVEAIRLCRGKGNFNQGTAIVKGVSVTYNFPGKFPVDYQYDRNQRKKQNPEEQIELPWN